MENLNIYGYIRVSSVGQNNIRQKNELSQFGVLEENMFFDTISGKDFNRTGYQKLRKKLKENDILVIKSLDRLGRNYEEILVEWSFISKTIKAHIVVLDMPLLDTRNSKDLTNTLISDIVLQLLSYVAQTEREFIKQRQAEGIALAKASGIKFGRPKKPYPKGFNKIYKQISNNEINMSKGAELLGIEYHKFYRLIQRKNKEVNDN